ncbi:lysoplasmalogenase [Novosphingobium cyanobacteriorum]|uniref:Lysoplasmalogenase n=1 Tax=Novosphingobium cyanobacteriorum TaxID=3024215 RepID=A0ABT6CEH2_9SPHN|nr:lysoplasmalogenase [Novosphingobium cyanobacteriorum]MDF8331868.1 lysoplasmalogenase [Novosphingobium cyanobacteriorum]
MAERGLIDRRPWLVASLLFGISYWFVAQGLVLPKLPGLLVIAWKGAGVALLAAYAWAHHPSRDAHKVALVMGLGAIGDMVLEVNFIAGAVAFLLGHLIAVSLYLRYRREIMSPSQRLAGLAVLVATPFIAFALTGQPTVALYSAALGAMAAAAWTSAFPRYRVGLGAVLFVASDLLIFARMGPLAGDVLAKALIWPLYYFGQFLICTGAISFLRRQGQFREE